MFAYRRKSAVIFSDVFLPHFLKGDHFMLAEIRLIFIIKLHRRDVFFIKCRIAFHAFNQLTVFNAFEIKKFWITQGDNVMFCMALNMVSKRPGYWRSQVFSISFTT